MIFIEFYFYNFLYMNSNYLIERITTIHKDKMVAIRNTRAGELEKLFKFIENLYISTI